ncbi:MAG TPA: hypothetical protein VGH90_11890 [Chthoniobacteraceae bacterium]|jgi:hypothetical protein
MNFVRACLFAVSSAVLAAIALAFGLGGLDPRIARVSLGIGAAVAAWTFWRDRNRPSFRRRKLNVWEWATIATFTLYSLRAFLWLIFINGDKVEVLQWNNMGDMSLHLTYIRELANGVHFWPANPIYTGATLTYPIGVDLLHSLLFLAGADLYRIFIWMGLIACLCTGLTLWRWGGAFVLAGFMFNGGLAGFLFFKNLTLDDYQRDLAWKSIPLTLFDTQRGLLFALPAGLLLLCSWRARFFGPPADRPDEKQGDILPWQGELLLYAAMPVFHLHTFLFLSFMLLAWFIVHAPARRKIAVLVAAALVPASALVLLMTGFFRGPSVLGWLPGWMQTDADFLKACEAHLGTTNALVTFPVFWFVNFGVLPILAGLLVWRLAQNPRLVWARAVVFPALGIFLLCCFVRFAPWAWDNTKLMIWSYLAVLPFLWRRVVGKWPQWAAMLACVALFWSGFVSLLGGLDDPQHGYEIATRTELDEVADALHGIPVDARFVASPIWNHPLLLLGRQLVLGYRGHVWSHGYSYDEPLTKVEAVLDGDDGWRAAAHALGARYIFWGTRERDAYPDSKETWRNETKIVASGAWGEIFDLGPP